jgi:MFS family permease
MSPSAVPERPRGGHGGLIGLLLAEAISTIGTRMSLLAIPWLVLVTTNDYTKMGIVTGAETLAYVLAGVFMTPVADRIGIYRVSIGTDIASALAMAAVAMYHGIGFWFLVLMVTIVGVLRSTGDKTKHVMLKPVADVAGTPMLRVTAAFDGLNRVSMLVAAGIGGVVIAWLGPPGAVWFDAATFAACAMILVVAVPGRLFRPTAPEPSTADTTETITAVAPVGSAAPPSSDIASAAAATQATATHAKPDDAKPDDAKPDDAKSDLKPVEALEEKESYWASVRAGFRFLRQDRLLFSLVAMLFVTNLFNQASAAIFVPVWVSQTFGTALALGYVGGSYALGAIVGNVVFAALAPRMPRYFAITVGFLIGGAPRFLALGLSRDLTLVVIVSFVSGIAMSSFNPTYGALIYERVPPTLLNRIFGVTAAITLGGVPLGGMVGAWLLDAFGLTRGLLIAGGMFFLVSLTPLLGYRTWRQIDATIEGRRQPRPNELGRLILVGLTRVFRPIRVALRFGREPRPRPITVTLRYDTKAGTWLVGARKGRRSLGRPEPISASEAVRRASTLEVSGLCEAVKQVNAAQMAAAEQRVEQLRGELARVEQRLAELQTAA